jgi:uncharacterized DUF497 family protein
MLIQFDAAKNHVNIAMHGLSLQLAEQLEWDTLWAQADVRQNYGELRLIGFAYIELRLFCVVFVDRGDVRRIISLRKANLREVNRYAQA